MDCAFPLRDFQIQSEQYEHHYATGLVMDIRELTFEDESFDVLIDKGTYSMVSKTRTLAPSYISV